MKNVSTLKKQKIADNSKFEDKKEIVRIVEADIND